MKTGWGLALIAVGAILAFAVNANTSVFNWNIAGWVLVIVGIAGILIPRRGYAWVGRRLFVRQARVRRPGDQNGDEIFYPSTSRVPAALPAPGAVGSREASAHVETGRTVSTSPDDMRPGETEVIEDVYED
jgi:hypothetical protein